MNIHMQRVNIMAVGDLATEVGSPDPYTFLCEMFDQIPLKNVPRISVVNQ